MLDINKKYLFIHVPKVAGQSIETMLLREHGKTWEQRAPYLLRENKDPTLGPPRLAHLSITEYITCGYISRLEFDSTYKFAFVRNPWDRVVSMHRYLTRSEMAFEDFVKKVLPNKTSTLSYFTKPQTFYTKDPLKRLKLDYIGKFENLLEDIEVVKKNIGMPSAKLSHLNKSKGAPLEPGTNPYRKLYTPETREIVRELYLEDIREFGYSF